jgi:hypothetical protein
MARAGMGGDARVDDVGVGNQHHGAVLNQKKVLDMISGLNRMYRISFCDFCAFCGLCR